MSKDLSIVIPVFNEEESIPQLIEWIFSVLKQHTLTAEIILVDDGSDDNSWNIIKKLSSKNSTIIGLRFARNYGKSAALQTGFEYANGEIVITMDADMQDSPDEIPLLIQKIKDENLHIVSGWKKKRKDSIGKTIPSMLFNWVTRKVSGICLHDFNCGLKAYKKEVVKNIQVYGEMHRYIPLIAKWNGYHRISEKVVQHYARKYGKSKYGTKRFITGFLDLLSVTLVYRFKKNPMHFFGTLGFSSFVIGFLITTWLIFQKLYFINRGLPVRDIVAQPLFFLALVALIIGMQLFLTGFLAELMVPINKKNDYIISESTQQK